MEGKRILFILILIGVFVAGVTLLKESFLRPNNGGSGGAGDPGTIRGVVSALLPSGKVIVVKKEDGTEVLVSLTGASAITNEDGEGLFYQDVSTGMPISAAGIRGEKDNVLIPSLVTVKTAYAYNGVMVVRATSPRPHIFLCTTVQKCGRSGRRLTSCSLCPFPIAAWRRGRVTPTSGVLGRKPSLSVKSAAMCFATFVTKKASFQLTGHYSWKMPG